jgi:dolichol kinase
MSILFWLVEIYYKSFETHPPTHFVLHQTIERERERERERVGFGFMALVWLLRNKVKRKGK